MAAKVQPRVVTEAWCEAEWVQKMLGSGCWALGWHCSTGMLEGTRISFPYLSPRGWASEGEDGTRAWGVQRGMLQGPQAGGSAPGSPLPGPHCGHRLPWA